ncbi:MAG: Gfo/Idh/MocA family oxidoreductase [Tetrasphaera sp.]
MNAPPPPVRVGLIGAGRIGRHHATALARHVPGANLVCVADTHRPAAHALAEALGTAAASIDALLGDEAIEAIVITAASTAHSRLIQRAAAAGKAVFCEKPMSMTLPDFDAAIASCQLAGVPLQVGFNRRFSADFVAAHEIINSGGIGKPQLLRSLTRDPGLANPGAVPPGTIFTQTLIHDFDALLWLNPGAAVVEVHAFADALVAPDFAAGGLLDTAIVTMRFDNGAMATAEANFAAAYGYDVRAEAFGSAGMVTVGGPVQQSAAHWTAAGVSRRTSRSDTELMHDAYVAEFVAFCDAVRGGTPVGAGGADAKAAFAVALAAWRSAESGRRVSIAEVIEGGSGRLP